MSRKRTASWRIAYFRNIHRISHVFAVKISWWQVILILLCLSEHLSCPDSNQSHSEGRKGRAILSRDCRISRSSRGYQMLVDTDSWLFRSQQGRGRVKGRLWLLFYMITMTVSSVKTTNPSKWEASCSSLWCRNLTCDITSRYDFNPLQWRQDLSKINLSYFVCQNGSTQDGGKLWRIYDVMPRHLDRENVA